MAAALVAQELGLEPLGRAARGGFEEAARTYLQIGDCFDKEEVETMSVAFTREESAETAAEVELPDRPISAHPNLVTASGLEALATAMAEWRAAYNAAQQIEDAGERRRAVAVASREMRYFADRLSTAQVVPPPSRVRRSRFWTSGDVQRATTVGARPSKLSGKTKRILGMDQFLTSPPWRGH